MENVGFSGFFCFFMVCSGVIVVIYLVLEKRAAMEESEARLKQLKGPPKHECPIVLLDRAPEPPPTIQPSPTSETPSMKEAGMERQRQAAPGWFRPAGIAAVALGVLAFCAEVAQEHNRDVAVNMFSGMTNPLFFVGVPLGLYWLYRSLGGMPQTTGRLPQADEHNPRLTLCPDCGRQVSRLATRCPQCGRPLAPEKNFEA